MRRFLVCLAFLGLASAGLADSHAPKGQVILTIGGDLPNPNAPGTDPDATDFFGYLDLEFKNAFTFDLAGLDALANTEVTADVLGLGDIRYSGPRLADVMTAAGAEGRTAHPMALDGYSAEIPWDNITAYQPILATRADGVPLPIGRLGPAMIVYPPTADPAINESFGALQVFAAFLITVD